MSTICDSWNLGIGLVRAGQADEAFGFGTNDWLWTGQEACPTRGSRFVWYGGGAEEEHVIGGALIVEMKAGLVTVHEAEGGCGGKVGEGFGHAIQRVAG
jgi:hypothetical protein